MGGCCGYLMLGYGTKWHRGVPLRTGISLYQSEEQRAVTSEKNLLGHS
jgi:hypothetical protein